MKRLLFVAPHLSTGGLPQYLVKKVELLRNEYDIFVVEYSDVTGGRLVVQRNRLIGLLKNALITLNEDKSELINIIGLIKPDIVHMEEIPEMFCDTYIADQIYNLNRTYSIYETSHDSSFDVHYKRYMPDKMILVSEYQRKLFQPLNIPIEVIDYPIEFISADNRQKYRAELGLDPTKKHILNVGLFTPRKNQKEFFEYARRMPEYQFHSVGNMADNFKFYWEPLLKDVPSNLKIWDERSDVHKFFEAMDLFLFTSRGSNSDKETMPLVLKEALAAKIPICLYDLEVYEGFFNQFNDVKYLNFNDVQKNDAIIKSAIEGNLNTDTKINTHKKTVFVISTYPNTKVIEDATVDCINSIKSFGYDVITTSHIEVGDNIRKYSDYVINDNNNILTKHTFYSNAWWKTSEYDLTINLKNENNDVYHGPSCYTNYKNGAELASELGYENIIMLNYDYILKNNSFIEDILSQLNYKKAYFISEKKDEGDTIVTWLMVLKPELFTSLPNVNTAKEYDSLMNIWNSESNGLENLMHHAFKGNTDVLVTSIDEIQNELDNTFNHMEFSRVEYLTILPTNMDNKLAVVFATSNLIDDRKLMIDVFDVTNSKNVLNDTLQIHSKSVQYKLFDFLDDISYIISLRLVDGFGKSEVKKIEINRDYIKNVLPNNGYLSIKTETSDVKPYELIDVNYNTSECKFYYTSNLKNEIDVHISISDIEMGCSYYINTDKMKPGINYWMIPFNDTYIRNGILSSKKFVGFSFNVYTKNRRLIYSKNFYQNGYVSEKRKFILDSFDQVGASYAHFFFTNLCDSMDLSGVVIDAGANVGFFTLLSLDRGASKVYTIEPDPSAFHYLQRNFEENKSVVLMKNALSTQNEIVKFYIMMENSVASSLIDAGDSSIEVNVNSITLGDILKNESIVNMVKLDIEGEEYSVMESLSKTDFDKINQFFIECHKSNVMPKRIHDILVSNGYEVTFPHSSINNPASFIYARKVKL
jgi:FkbM family methyltransferase